MRIKMGDVSNQRADNSPRLPIGRLAIVLFHYFRPNCGPRTKHYSRMTDFRLGVNTLCRHQSYMRNIIAGNRTYEICS